MRDDEWQSGMFSYVMLEQRIRKDHPLRGIRVMVDRALDRMDADFDALYSHTGRPSIAPERLLRSSLLMVLYSIRSERQLMEQTNYNLLFRWFVGLEMDDPVWDVTVFTKNRELGWAAARSFTDKPDPPAARVGLRAQWQGAIARSDRVEHRPGGAAVQEGERG